MERNEENTTPVKRKPGGCPCGCGGKGSNKLVIAIWAAIVFGVVGILAYSGAQKEKEALRLLDQAREFYDKQDFKASTDCLRKAAELGNQWAQAYYGERLMSGFGVEKNVPEAVKWFRKSADQNCYEALYQLGLCYESGEGVERNQDEAKACYRKAEKSLEYWAKQGNQWAQIYYGEWLRNGLFGVEKNVPEALKWIRKSADQNCPEALYQLGACYENGEGVERNLDEAEAWYRKALDAGYGPLAQNAIDRIAWMKATGYTGTN